MERIFNNVKITSSFEIPETRENLVSGETIGQHFGKIAKVIDDLENGEFSRGINEKITEHTDNGDIHVTVSDKENWNSHPNDVTASGNPVQLSGLQGGVPFADISVSGGDILGQELTVSVSGKNLLDTTKYTPKSSTINSTIDENGIVTVSTTNPFEGNNTPVTANIETLIPIGVLNRDCTIGITWIDGLWRDSDSLSTWLGVNIVFYDINKNDIPDTIKFERTLNGVRGLNKIATISNETMEIPETAAYFSVNFWISGGTYLTDFKYALQLEYGTEATEYEPYHGAEYTITPDSNPYVIPNDIRQQDGLNVISVSAGELSVTGVKENAAIKKIWDEIDKIKTAIIVSNGEIE